MEADGEHNTRGTANTVTNDQRLDQLEDLVREIYRHVVSNGYSERETPGPTGNFSNASMSFGANAVDGEFAVENAIDRHSCRLKTDICEPLVNFFIVNNEHY